MTIDDMLEEARNGIAGVPDEVLEGARKRWDEIRGMVEEEFDALRTFGLGSPAHGN